MSETIKAEKRLEAIVRDAFGKGRRTTARYIGLKPKTEPEITDARILDSRIAKAMFDIDTMLIKAAAKAEFRAAELLPSLDIMHSAIRLMCLKTLRDPDETKDESETFLFGVHRNGVDYLEKVAEWADDADRFAKRYKKLLGVKVNTTKVHDGHTVNVYILDVGRKLRSAVASGAL